MGRPPKDKSTKSSLSYTRLFGTGSNSPAFPQNDPLGINNYNSIYDDFDNYSIEAETARRNKLWKMLDIAKRNNDKILEEKISKELGINEPKKDSTKSEYMEQIDQQIRAITSQLGDPNLDDDMHERLLKNLAALNHIKNPNAMMPMASRPKPKEKDKFDTLIEKWFESEIMKKKDDSGKSDFDKFLEYQEKMAQFQQNPIEAIKDAKETLRAVGLDPEQKNPSSQYELEKMKMEHDYKLRNRELDVETEKNKTMGNWIKELSSTVVESIVDSIDEDEEEGQESKTDTKKEDKEEEKVVAKDTSGNKPKIRQVSIKCFNCKKMFEIPSPEETREVYCGNCNWPHYWNGDTSKAKSIVPDLVREKLKMEPNEFLEQYEDGQLTELLEAAEKQREGNDE